jgi:4-amino-4-deoxy-L-arabinose transferase-like glycosyltransferase
MARHRPGRDRRAQGRRHRLTLAGAAGARSRAFPAGLVTPRRGLAVLLALTALRLGLAALLPLTPDEAYYWIWSRHLQAGYFDGPALIALWIRAGTSVLGATPLGIRLLSPIAAAAASALLWRAGEDLFPGRQAGLLAAALLNATAAIGAGSIITTPDTPLLLFWTATLTALARWQASGRERWWLAAGLTGGLAMDAKYTGLLIFAAASLWLLLTRTGRGALRRPLPWAGLAVGFLVFVPTLVWNATHGWASFVRQGGRVLHRDLAGMPGHLAALVAGQIGLATPLVALLMAVGVARAWRSDSAPARLALLAAIVPLAVFLQHTLSGPVQANWPAILYPGAILCAAGCANALARRWLTPALILGALVNGAIYLQAVAAPLPLPPHRDPLALQLAGWRPLARAAARAVRASRAQFLAAPDYATAAALAYELKGRVPVIGFGPRWRTFALPQAGAMAGLPAVLIAPRRRGPPDPAWFAAVRPLGTAARREDGRIVERYALYRVRARPAAPGAVLVGLRGSGQAW